MLLNLIGADFQCTRLVGEAVLRKTMKENQIAKTYKVSTWLKRRQRVLAYFANFMGKSKKDIGLREC